MNTTLLEVSEAERQRVAQRALQTRINTSIPCIIERVHTKTVDVALPVLRQDAEGNSLDPVQVLDVPVIFPGAGDYSARWTLRAGDTGMLLVAQRDMDRWLNTGAQGVPLTARLHDYSDGAFLPGLRPDAAAPDIPTDGYQIATRAGVLQFDDGGTITLRANSGAVLTLDASGAVRLRADGLLTVEGDSISVAGDTSVTVAAPAINVTADATAIVSGGAGASLSGPGGSMSMGGGSPSITSASGGDSGESLGDILIELANTLRDAQAPSGSSGGPLSTSAQAATIAAKMAGFFS